MKDDSSGLVWGPEAPETKNWEDKDFGYNKPLLKAMDMKNKWFCSSSTGADDAWFFNGSGGEVGHDVRGYRITVRCVGRLARDGPDRQ